MWDCPNCGEHRACTRPVSADGLACRFHGGNSLKGIEHPNYQGRGYSKYMPSGLVKKYQQFVTDPSALSLEEEVAISRALLAERLSLGSSVEAWREANELYSRMVEANQAGEFELFWETLNKLGEVLQTGSQLIDGEEKTIRLLEQVRKTVDAQRQIYVDKGQMVTIGTVLMMWDELKKGLIDYVLPLEGGTDALRALATIIRRFGGHNEPDRQ